MFLVSYSLALYHSLLVSYSSVSHIASFLQLQVYQLYIIHCQFPTTASFSALYHTLLVSYYYKFISSVSYIASSLQLQVFQLCIIIPCQFPVSTSILARCVIPVCFQFHTIRSYYQPYSCNTYCYIITLQVFIKSAPIQCLFLQLEPTSNYQLQLLLFYSYSLQATISSSCCFLTATAYK